MNEGEIKYDRFDDLTGKCITCYYWGGNRLDSYKDQIDLECQNPFSACHRFPPIHIVYLSNGDTYSDAPRTSFCDWCGEYLVAKY